MRSRSSRGPIGSASLAWCVLAALGSAGHAAAQAAAWTDPSPHEVRFVSVAPDVTLEVLDWGGTGEPLVLLAGMQATAHTFDDFAPELSDAARVIAVTRRGFGASSQPAAGYDLATLANDVRVVLDSLGIERATLVGHSFGASEATRFAALWPDRVSRLVNIDGLMIADDEAFMEAMVALPGAPPASDADRASLTAYRDYIARIYGVPLTEAEIRARWRVLPDGSVGEPVTPERVMLAIFQHGSSTPLDDVHVPLLALRAVSSSAAALIPYYEDLDREGREQADQAFPALQRVWDDGWASYARMPGATIVDFQDANHHLYISDKGEVIEEIRAFLMGSERPDEDAEPAALPVAEPNDHRRTAGRMIDGERVIELEAVEAAWYPRGPDGPRLVTPAFREPGRAPQVPGPLIRASAGTPVRVSVRNTLARTITIRGLADRASLNLPDELPDQADPGDPRFFFADSLVVPAGATREARFTPTSEVSSFYYGRRAAPEGGYVGNAFVPGSFGDEGAFLGGVVVDPAGVDGPPDERVMLISRWGGRDEPSTLQVTFKMMINGLSWPHTERLRYQVGDTVRWRVINTSRIEHPMHLHGFYFRIDARGDADADTVYALGDRPLAVTDVMPDFSSLRLTWIPDRPGNWLFHCHLIRHMGASQQFAAERAEAAGRMAGLVMGITIDPEPGASAREPPAERTIHLWTARRPDVFGEDPALSFVAGEEGSWPPATDTVVVPGTPLVLERGEPTDIVVHNRLDAPLSVHWHGLEVRSPYDGVADWSGRPGATRPPVAPGASTTVRITPPRAGTFIYHVHGERGHELSQGLYGPFLVLPEGEAWDRERDRVFVLAARGALRDPPPVVNGQEAPPPERFQAGGTYRLRFIHISPDAFDKRVRLLRDGEPVEWRPLAKDGADFLAATRPPGSASVHLGVGETFDAEWTPRVSGAYTLEVVTTHYSASGLPPTVQRIGFGVGEVSEEALVAAAHIEPVAPPPPSPLDTLPAVELNEAQLRPLIGTWSAPGVPVDFTVEWRDGGLVMSLTGQEPAPLVPLSPTLFRWEDEPSVPVVLERDDEPTMVVFGIRLRRRGMR